GVGPGSTTGELGEEQPATVRTPKSNDAGHPISRQIKWFISTPRKVDGVERSAASARRCYTCGTFGTNGARQKAKRRISRLLFVTNSYNVAESTNKQLHVIFADGSRDPAATRRI